MPLDEGFDLTHEANREMAEGVGADHFAAVAPLLDETRELAPVDTGVQLEEGGPDHRIPRGVEDRLVDERLERRRTTVEEAHRLRRPIGRNVRASADCRQCERRDEPEVGACEPLQLFEGDIGLEALHVALKARVAREQLEVERLGLAELERQPVRLLDRSLRRRRVPALRRPRGLSSSTPPRQPAIARDPCDEISEVVDEFPRGL